MITHCVAFLTLPVDIALEMVTLYLDEHPDDEEMLRIQSGLQMVHDFTATADSPTQIN